jgi:hypothetical protein
MIRSIFALAIATIVVAGCVARTEPLGNEVLNASMNPKIARVVIYVKPPKLPDWSPDWLIHAQDSVKNSKQPDWLASLQPEFVIDGKSIGTWQLGFVMCDLQPGRHVIVAASNSIGLAGSESLSVDLRAGAVTYFAAAVQMSLVVDQLTLTNVTNIQGRADVGDLHQISAGCTTS